MDNKIIVKLLVPEIDESFDLYLPVTKKIGNIIGLLNQAISELTYGTYQSSDTALLFNRETKETYNSDTLLINTNIRNGTKLILLSK